MHMPFLTFLWSRVQFLIKTGTNRMYGISAGGYSFFLFLLHLTGRDGGYSLLIFCWFKIIIKRGFLSLTSGL